ncbi:prephenate dehydratase [Methanococcus aeolicus]|uniref:prephenate dehydratase n=1 Tax=Methanococcus aeolicus (strain ATCC BAA-1280 / DSM 17508 / OCM 812 / Nankai-3) TaxID=419665 RepID=A6UUB3_META3|nr:prephenate dehydratase [Methanococcus aeolicus]ABR56085.1 Prephenate dehydratase [Methanococcus aeolicus Nankai-3]UXM85312.1 prephenate dehydratase [Methanococcus aeolicus]
MIYCLGPKGSYTEEAAEIFSKIIKDKNIEYCNSIYEVFERVEQGNNNCYGVVPSENSIEGSVSLTMDLLLEFPVKILGEVDININHCLIGYSKDKIKKILAHPQALAQCRKYIKKHDWETESVLSNSMAVKKVYDMKNEELGAIASKKAGKLYNLNILDTNIQDYPNNTTRFILIGKDCEDSNDISFTNNDTTKKSTIIIELIGNKPGALYNILKEFNKKNINLTRIESRPSKTKLGSYIFYIDYETPENEKELINSLKNYVSNIKYLGSSNIFSKFL